jgi:hypothetical protein
MPVEDPSIKKPRSIEWTPTSEEVAKIKIASTPLKQCAGLRGLRNMGSTVFITTF